MPDQHCPVPMEQLENYRRTIARKADGSTEDFEEQLHDLQQGQTKRPLSGPAWTGETWFKVKKDIKPPKPRPPSTTTLTTSPGILPSTTPTPTAPATRHTIKKPLDTSSTQNKNEQQPTYVPASTSLPKPKDTPDTTGDYWIKEGHLWKRVHQQPRTDLYIPQQTHDGPDVTKLTTERSTFVMPTDGNRQYRIDDDWTTKTKATLNKPWTGSTNFQENTAYKDEYYTVEEEEQQQAIPAKGIKSPEQPRPQERAEHNLTHLPFRSWCQLCVQSKGKADAYKQQKQTSTTPVLQFDFCYFKTIGEIRTTPILTGIDVETGMAMAVVTDNKSGDFTYHVQAIQAFLLKCGRVQATLNSTVLQSDQEDHLIALLKATAAKMGGNISVRQSPAYSSQSQGSVERFHRTLMGQVRTLKAQLEHNYNIRLTSQHPIMPWLVRHSVYLLNRYAVHADGNTSFFRRWNKKHQSPLCEFGETVQYQLPTHKDLPKLEPRFMPAIWLSKDTASGETLLGIVNKVIRARTIRRQPHPEKYNKQLMDAINNNGLAKFATGGPALTQPPVFYKPLRREQTTAETQTLEAHPTTETTSTLPTTSALPFAPMATSPTSYHTRPALPSPTSASKRSVNDEISQGSEAKQQRTDTQTVGPARPETAAEPTTKHKATSCTDFSSHNSNKERNTHYSTVLWGPNRSHHWTHSPRTNRQQHRRIGQTKDNRGNEERDWTNEVTTGLHRSELQHSHTRTTDEHHSISMGSQRQRQHSASTHCSKRIHRNNIRHGWHLRINTDFLRTPIASHTQHQQRLDHTNRRHFRCISTRACSNIGSLHVSTNRVLHTRFRSDLETQQSNLWTAQQPKSMASTSGRNTPATRPTQKHSRAQCLLHNITRLLHPSVCRWPDVPGCRQHDQQDLRCDPTTSHAEINRHTDTGQHRRFSGTEHHQHGWSLRNQPGRQLHNKALGRDQSFKLQTCDNTRHISTENSNSRTRTEAQPRRTFGIPTSSWKTTMDDIHTSRHKLRNKGTRSFLTRANNSRPTETQTPTEIHQRNWTLQADYPTNNQGSGINSSGPQHLRRQRLGRMPRDKEVNNRLRHHNAGSNNQLWQQNTSNNCAIKRRRRAVCNQHRSNRIIAS